MKTNEELTEAARLACTSMFKSARLLDAAIHVLTAPHSNVEQRRAALNGCLEIADLLRSQAKALALGAELDES